MPQCEWGDTWKENLEFFKFNVLFCLISSTEIERVAGVPQEELLQAHGSFIIIIIW